MGVASDGSGDEEIGEHRDMSKAAMVAWLKACARYFENRDTHGEDMAHWSNVYNAKNAREIADYLEKENEQV
jgi:hypothetical protein